MIIAEIEKHLGRRIHRVAHPSPLPIARPHSSEPRMSTKKSFTELFRPLSSKAPGSRRRVAPEENPALEAIWHMVCAIPRGQASTYGAVARAAGLPGRARQAGFALRMAPKEMNLPWHRVVGAGGRIVFPKSSREHREQARRLRAEGVAVKNGRVQKSALTLLDDR
jgi:methylated-DNA-protein-cysteine methyltransferase-like protein